MAGRSAPPLVLLSAFLLGAVWEIRLSLLLGK